MIFTLGTVRDALVFRKVFSVGPRQHQLGSKLRRLQARSEVALCTVQKSADISFNWPQHAQSDGLPGLVKVSVPLSGSLDTVEFSTMGDGSTLRIKFNR